MSSRSTLAALLATVALVAAGCGGDDGGGDTGGGSTGGSTASAGAVDGAQIFSEQCSSCHTLAAADANGKVGPNLDETSFDLAAVETQIRDGSGGMPSFGDQLSDAEITAVAQYIEDNKSG